MKINYNIFFKVHDSTMVWFALRRHEFPVNTKHTVQKAKREVSQFINAIKFGSLY